MQESAISRIQADSDRRLAEERARYQQEKYMREAKEETINTLEKHRAELVQKLEDQKGIVDELRKERLERS